MNLGNSPLTVGTSAAVAVANYYLGGTGQISGTNLYVGSQAGASGKVNQSGGTMSFNNEQLGISGTGSFTQTGGTNTTDSLTVGTSGGAGVYMLSAGTLTVTNGEIIGNELYGYSISMAALITFPEGWTSVRIPDRVRTGCSCLPPGRFRFLTTKKLLAMTGWAHSR